MTVASSPRLMGTANAIDTLRRLEGETATGRLDFSTELGRAQVYLRNGVLVAARSGDLDGLPALFRLLSAGEAHAEFVAEAVPPTPPLVENVGWLVAERRARTERWQELCAQAPPLFAPLRVSDRGRAELLGSQLDERQRKVMQAIDGQRNVTEVLVASGLEALDAIETVVQCMHAGLLLGPDGRSAPVVVQPAPRPVSAAAAPGPAAGPAPGPPGPSATPSAASVPQVPVQVVTVPGPSPSANAAPRAQATPSVPAATPAPAAPTPASATTAPAATPAPAPGVLGRIGNYSILGRLGRGDHGPVFECRREAGGTGWERLALKLLRGTPSDAERRRFFDGLEVAKGLNHPNLVKIVDGGETTDGIFVVSQLVPGLSLRELLSRSPMVRPPDRIARIILDVLSGIAAAQLATTPSGRRHGIVVCDLSPESLLVGEDGVCRLLDFGLASTGDPVLRGKPGYLAPEQILRGQADERTNLFSVGTLLFNALTGIELFGGETLRESLHLVCTRPIQPPSAVGLKPPPHWDAFCSRALEREPERRFASATEMARELSRLVDSSGMHAPYAAIADWVLSLVHSPDA